MNEQIPKLTINSLADKISKEAIQAATYESLYTIATIELEQMKKIIESDEELKAKFEEVKGQMTNGN
ncbi:hypothetical protein [Streptococcus oralis]|uniref:hypothetical protein n=1 Tax=Streptococcus oralis TaxID=1303 RepID=UPI00066EA677|nr:hypothetical protein [Streptococcus oralis]HAP8374358.1 hypothetical protein [Enterococcus faecium]